MGITQIRLPQTSKQSQLPPFLSIHHDKPTSYKIELENYISTLSINPNTATLEIHNSSQHHTFQAHNLTVSRHLLSSFININCPSEHLTIKCDQYETLLPQLALFALSPPNFVLLVPLGAGITSSVFLARDIRTMQLVAVRITRSIDLRFLNLSHDFAERALLIPSTKLPAHPCIHKYTSAFWHRGNLYAVAKYMNHSMRQFLSPINQDGNSINLSHVKFIMKSLLSAISHMHAHGFVHGNISAQHILIHCNNDMQTSQIDDVTLTGFSQSATKINFTSRDKKQIRKVTNKSNYFRTNANTPPEGHNLKQPGPKADVWAAGLILRQLTLNLQSQKHLNHFNSLMFALLQPVPAKRLTSRAALEHPALKDCCGNISIMTMTSRCESDVDIRGTFRNIVKKTMVMSGTVKCWQRAAGIEVVMAPFIAS